MELWCSKSRTAIWLSMLWIVCGKQVYICIHSYLQCCAWVDIRVRQHQYCTCQTAVHGINPSCCRLSEIWGFIVGEIYCLLVLEAKELGNDLSGSLQINMAAFALSFLSSPSLPEDDNFPTNTTSNEHIALDASN